MDIGVAQIKAVWTLPSIYKVTPGSSYFFANYCCVNIFFEKDHEVIQSHQLSCYK